MESFCRTPWLIVDEWNSYPPLFCRAARLWDFNTQACEGKCWSQSSGPQTRLHMIILWGVLKLSEPRLHPRHSDGARLEWGPGICIFYNGAGVGIWALSGQMSDSTNTASRCGCGLLSELLLLLLPSLTILCCCSIPPASTRTETCHVLPLNFLQTSLLHLAGTRVGGKGDIPPSTHSKTHLMNIFKTIGYWDMYHLQRKLPPHPSDCGLFLWSPPNTQRKAPSSVPLRFHTLKWESYTVYSVSTGI